MSKRKLTYKDFIHYFSNNLQNKEKHSFEKQIMQDAFEEEAFDGLSQLNKDELEKDIEELKGIIKNKAKQSKHIIPVWFRYAASILLLVGVGITLYVVLNQRQWQETMLKEQVSQEMELPDSNLLFTQPKADSVDTLKPKPDFIAENRDIKKPEVKTELKVVEDKIVIEDELILDDSEADMDEAIVVMEFKEEEEVVEELPAQNFAVAEAVTEVKKEEANAVAGAPMAAKRAKQKSDDIEKTSTLATTKTIKGKVLGTEDNLSIPGVSITLKDNPKIGTTTDMDGNFELNVPVDDEELKTLIASFVGMHPQEISLEGDSNLLVYMEPEVLAMDEVVVVAYGVEREEKEIIKTNAQPPNGVSLINYKKAIEENLNYSKLSAFPGKYKIKVSFTVNANGSLSYFSFKNTPDSLFSNEIMQVIKEMGYWIPATENNQNISSEVKLTLRIEVN
ncbi:MAG TPA: carboxypeptidase-like regulatory domain-containing protein [Bacteroidales bacterium]|nr:carboxypeptidase-like regulatory domain-containing protein [Bacteroidales bacterium]